MRQTNPCAVSKSLRGLASFDHCPRPKSLADTLSYLHIPKPFKNSKYIRQGNKRNRSVKQLLAGDREREKAHHEQAKQAMQIDQTPAAEHVFCDCFFTPPTQFQPLIHRASDSSIEAPPSILPPSKYCDITGLHVSFSLPSYPYPLSKTTPQGAIHSSDRTITVPRHKHLFSNQIPGKFVAPK